MQTISKCTYHIYRKYDAYLTTGIKYIGKQFFIAKLSVKLVSAMSPYKVKQIQYTYMKSITYTKPSERFNKE